MKSYIPQKNRKTTTPYKNGIFVAKEGKEVYSQNPSDYDFLTSPSVSIKKRLSLQVSTVGDEFDFFVFNDVRTYTAEYKHNFGYIPQVIAFVTTADDFAANEFELRGTYINVPSMWENGDIAFGTNHIEIFDCWADEVNVYISASRYHFMSMIGLWNRSGNYTFDILLLMEEAK